MGSTTCVQWSAALGDTCESRVAGDVGRTGVEACGMPSGAIAGGGPDSWGSAGARRPMTSATQGEKTQGKSCRIVGSTVAYRDHPVVGTRVPYGCEGRHVRNSSQRDDTCSPSGHTS